jgi:cytochrome c-type biogenesis protein CcmF
MKLVDAKGTEFALTPRQALLQKEPRRAEYRVAIQSSWRQDVYLTLAGWEPSGEVAAIQAIVNPLVSWIWIGGIVLSAGSLFALFAAGCSRTPPRRPPKRTKEHQSRLPRGVAIAAKP